MGRLADLFDHHRDNVEEAVKKALGRADDTIEALRKRVDELEAKLRDVAGSGSTSEQTDNSLQNASVTTTENTGEAKKQARTKR